MKKINILFFLAMFCAFSISAQKPNITADLSPELEEPVGSTLSDIIGESNEGFYAVRKLSRMRQQIFIESYDSQYKMKSSDKIEMEADGKDLIYENTVLLNGSLYIFGSYFDRKNDEERLYAFQMDAKTLNYEGKPRLIATAESKRNSTFKFDLSNSEKFLSIFSIPGNDDDNIYAYTISVFSGDLDEIWAQKVKSEYEESTFFALSAQVDDKGNAYLLARKYDKPLKGIKFKPAYKMMMIAYTNEGANESAFDLNLKRGYINDLSYRIMDNGNIVCGGFYSENYGGGYKGVCIFIVDPNTGSIIQEGGKEFSSSDLADFMSERKADKGKELYNFDLSDIVLREDGGLVMVGEYYYVSAYTRTSGTTSYTTYTYYYNSLLVVNVSPDLSIDWMVEIPKRQVTSNDGGYYSSYAMMVKGENLYFLFNDNEKNAQVNAKDKLANFNGKNSIVSLVTLSADGSMKKTIFLDNKEEGIILRPKICSQVSEDNMIIYGERKNTYKVGKLTF